MSPFETALLAYGSAGLTCWIVLAIVYVRMGHTSLSLQSIVQKLLVAVPVIALWPLLIAALLRAEWFARRHPRTTRKQDEPSQARPDRVEGR